MRPIALFRRLFESSKSLLCADLVTLLDMRTCKRARAARVKMNQKSPIMSMESFEALVAPHLQPLHGFACRRTRDPIDAEDLVQDALLRAWDRIDSLGDPERIRSWLFTILVNLHIEQLRKRTRRQRLLPIVDLDARARRARALPIPLAPR